MILDRNTRADGNPVILEHHTYAMCEDCDHYFDEPPMYEPSHVCTRIEDLDPIYATGEHWIVAVERKRDRIAARFDTEAEARTMFAALVGPISQLSLLQGGDT